MSDETTEKPPLTSGYVPITSVDPTVPAGMLAGNLEGEFVIREVITTMPNFEIELALPVGNGTNISTLKLDFSSTKPNRFYLKSNDGVSTTFGFVTQRGMNLNTYITLLAGRDGNVTALSAVIQAR